MPPKKVTKVIKNEIKLEPTFKANPGPKFATTSSGLIQYNFNSDSDDDDVPAPLSADMMEHELGPIQQAKNKKDSDMDAQFFTELSKNPLLYSNPDQQAQLDELSANNRTSQIQRTINSHADLIRKRALASSSRLNVVNNKDVQSQNNNSRLEQIIRSLTKQVYKKEYEMADSDLDSDASDYDPDCLPYLDEDKVKSIHDKANKMLQQENIKKATTPKVTAAMTDIDDEFANMTPEQIEKYRRAAQALESSDDEEEFDEHKASYRYGESDEEDADEDDEQLSIEDKLNKDVFETQTNAFTTDDKGDLIRVNHNITFNEMFLSKPTIFALQKNGFNKPTPIQAAAVPLALKGFDIMANAVTGSGKTIAFLLPIIERLTRMPQRSRAIRAVIVTPTRELAEQIFKVAVSLTRFNTAAECSISCIFGGVKGQSQEVELRQHPDIVVCTPGRFIDHLTNTPGVSIDRCEVLVLDEADRLLDMGFRDEVGHIIDLTPKFRQTLLFSATVNSDVEDLIKQSLRGYRRVFVDKASSIVQTLTQQFIRLRHDNDVLRQAIVLSLCKREFKSKCIIFCKTKQFAQSLNILFKLTGLQSGELHGNLSQTQRSEVLDLFRKGELDFLIATDIAARGLDIKGVLTVINMHLPINYNSYVHRVGRTARAGEKGVAISLVADNDRRLLREMMKVHDMKDDENPFKAKDVKDEPGSKKKAKKSAGNNLLLNLKKREISPAIIDKYSNKIYALQPHIDELAEEIRSLKEIELAEKQIDRAERMLNLTVQDAKEKSQDPKRAWFQSTQERALLKDKLKAEMLSMEAITKASTAMLNEVKELAAEENGQKKTKTKEEQLRGLSRDEKRRKLFQFEQEKIARDLRNEIANNKELTIKQRKEKEHELVSILKPEITAGFIKRQTKRDRMNDVEMNKERDDDGAGPSAFIDYAKQFDKLKFQNNARKRKLQEDIISAKSAQVKHRRFVDQDSVKDPTKQRRFKESTDNYEKKLASIDKENKESRKKTQSHNKFKSNQRYKRR